jgi:type II secretion system protein I
MRIQFAKKSVQAGSAPPRRGGFTLLEVMFAVVAFCTATFAILALVSQSLQNARRLQRPMVDAGLVAAQLSLTNQLVEGTESGDLGDLLGDAYKGYTWDYAIDEAQTNKLFQVVIAVQSNEGNKPVVSKMTVLFYRPDSPAGSLDGGNFIHP